MLPASTKRRLSQTDFTADEVAAEIAAAVAAEKARTAEAVAAAVAIAQKAAAETASTIAKAAAETAAAAIAAAQAAAAATSIASTATAAATAATAASKREQNWICGICQDLYDKPTSTPCGHTFCLTCIKAAIGVKAECPNCRAKVSRSLPLAVNIAMQDFIAENAGPLFVKRKAELIKSEAFYKALVDLNPVTAIAALSPDVDLRRFVGNAALKLTPLLWACKNADDKNDLVDEWNDLIIAALAAGADFTARDSKGNSAVSLAVETCNINSWTAAIPALLNYGAREPSALSSMLLVSFGFLPAHEINKIDAVLLRMAEDASYSHLTLTQKREDLANMLKNGFDRTAMALFDQNVRLVQPHKMLLWAASGGCSLFIRKLIAAKLVPVDYVFEYDQTALHVACFCGQENAALALLKCGASNFENDELKNTPLYYAKKVNMNKVVKALNAKGCTN